MLTQSELHMLFIDDGKNLIRKENPNHMAKHNARYEGKIVGYIKKVDGEECYLQTKINRSVFLVHRILYTMRHGEIPVNFDIDHDNGNGLDNSYDNLRLATKSQNMHNRKINKDKKDGLPKGISLGKNKAGYRYRVGYKGKSFEKGGFSTAELAFKARVELVNKLHGEFANHG